MPHYEILFDGADDSTGRMPDEGAMFEFGGRLWEVDKVETGDAGFLRIHLVSRSGARTGAATLGNGNMADYADVEAHGSSVTKLAQPPTSFETELVYTLNDISTRLGTLAHVLNAYWGKGAA